MLGFVCDVMSYICLEILITISGAKNYLCPSAFVEPSHLILMFPFYCFSHPQEQSLFKKKKVSLSKKWGSKSENKRLFSVNASWLEMSFKSRTPTFLVTCTGHALYQLWLKVIFHHTESPQWPFLSLIPSFPIHNVSVSFASSLIDKRKLYLHLNV